MEFSEIISPQKYIMILTGMTFRIPVGHCLFRRLLAGPNALRTHTHFHR